MNLDEESEKPCIQDRLRSIILNRFNVRFIFFTLIILILYFLSAHLGVEVFLNTEVLKLLVSIEAPMLSFYGLMFTYMLNSLDTRKNIYDNHQSLIKRVEIERIKIELELAERNGTQGKWATHDLTTQKRMKELEELKEKRLQELGVKEEKRASAQIDNFKKSKKHIGITFIFTLGSIVISMLTALLLISLTVEGKIIVNKLTIFGSIALIALFINSFINFLLLIYNESHERNF